MFSTHGSDALRWFLMSSPILRGADLEIDRKGKAIGEVVRLVLNPIWNAWYFFALYANADGIAARFRTDATGRLDRYALAKTRAMVVEVEAAMEAYDIPGACAAIRAFLDALNNWYIRRSRPRFWREEQDDDKRDAYDTLYTVLSVFCRAAAPLLPLLSEEIYGGLTGGGESVHLADWPDVDALPDDPELVADMDRVRTACSATLALREEHRLRVRLPLASLTIAGAGADRLEPYFDLIRDEVNVKAVHTSGDLEAFGHFDLKVDARRVGPRLGGEMKAVLTAAREGDWSSDDAGGVVVGGQRLAEGEFSLRLLPRDGLDGVAVESLPSNDALVALDVRTDGALEREGLARDVVRLIATARKEAGLHVSDRIRLYVEASEAVSAALEEWGEYVRRADPGERPRALSGAGGSASPRREPGRRADRDRDRRDGRVRAVLLTGG